MVEGTKPKDYYTDDKGIVHPIFGVDQIEDDDGDTKVQVEASADEDKIKFTTAGTLRATIDETGKVGIGTTSPSEKLEVNGNIISSNLTTGSVLFAGANGLISQDNADFFWHTANKRLGIGTTNPYSKFHVKGTGHEYLYLEVPSGYVAGWIFKEAAANKFQIRYYAGVFRIYDYSVATDVFNIKAGKVGIGTTSPATSALLDLTSATGALLVSRMTTVQRDALTAVNGMIIYNSSTNAFNFYENGAWVTGSGLA